MSLAAGTMLATRKPARACRPIVLAVADRVVKASPAGGLRPTLTTLPAPQATSAASVTTR